MHLTEARRTHPSKVLVVRLIIVRVIRVRLNDPAGSHIAPAWDPKVQFEARRSVGKAKEGEIFKKTGVVVAEKVTDTPPGEEEEVHDDRDFPFTHTENEDEWEEWVDWSSPLVASD